MDRIARAEDALRLAEQALEALRAAAASSSVTEVLKSRAA